MAKDEEIVLRKDNGKEMIKDKGELKDILMVLDKDNLISYSHEDDVVILI
jgi:hypothetical protein